MIARSEEWTCFANEKPPVGALVRWRDEYHDNREWTEAMSELRMQFAMDLNDARMICLQWKHVGIELAAREAEGV